MERIGKRDQMGIGRVLDGGRAAFGGGARGEQQHGVACRRVTIDGDAVEGPVDRVLDKALQHGLADIGIGEHEAEHRRHVWRDHARTFAEPGERHGRLAHLHGADGELRVGVGGHDGAGGGIPGVRFGGFGHAIQQVRELRRVHRFADHAG